MMQASAPELDTLSVYQQSSHGICTYGPDTEKSLRLIGCDLIVRNKMRCVLSEVSYNRFNPVKAGSFRIPEKWILNGKIHPRGLRITATDIYHALHTCGKFTGILCEKRKLNLCHAVSETGILNLDKSLQECITVCHLFGTDIYPVGNYMDLGGVTKECPAVKSRSRIPPGIRLHACIDIDGDAVFLSECYVIGQIDVEGSITVVAYSDPASVYIHCGIHHDSVEFQSDAGVLPLFGNEYMFRIAGESSGKESRIHPCRCILGYRSAYHSVMGKIYIHSGISLHHGYGIKIPSSKSPFFIDRGYDHIIVHLLLLFPNCS